MSSPYPLCGNYWLTRDIAVAEQIRHSTVWMAIATGKLPATRVGTLWLVDAKDYEVWRAARDAK